MTNKTALFFAFLLIATYLADRYYFHWDLLGFWFHQINGFAEWLSFWN